MQIEIRTGQELVINNMTAKIISIHPEIPSLYTTITFEYMEGPYAGVQKTLILNNQQ